MRSSTIIHCTSRRIKKFTIWCLVPLATLWSLSHRPKIVLDVSDNKDSTTWKTTSTVFSNKEEDSNSGAGPSPLTSPPPPCTASQREIIQFMLPDSQTLRWSTNCPDSTWMEDAVPHPKQGLFKSATQKLPTLWEVPDEPRKSPPTAIFVGCNKALDAVNTLRMLSLNSKFDKTQWRASMGILESACGQHKSPQFPLPHFENWKMRRKAQVYCIEAMPSTFTKLDRITNQLKWQDSLRMIHAAMSDPSNETSVLFPNALVGTEDLGMQDCDKPKYRKNCEHVPLMTLDSFVQNHDLPVIDVLSIDVEGNDWPVLLGSMNVTLPRVKYLEFEYHKVGRWQDVLLKPLIDMLQQHNFVCYWAGRGGKLWRITDCWMEHYNEWKEWSNVACVQGKRAPTLAARMEARFLSTLEAYKRFHDIANGTTVTFMSESHPQKRA